MRYLILILVLMGYLVIMVMSSSTLIAMASWIGFIGLVCLWVASYWE